MSLEEKSKITNINGSCYILIPRKVLKDSRFPFLEKELLNFTISNRRLIISKLEQIRLEENPIENITNESSNKMVGVKYG